MWGPADGLVGHHPLPFNACLHLPLPSPREAQRAALHAGVCCWVSLSSADCEAPLAGPGWKTLLWVSSCFLCSSRPPAAGAAVDAGAATTTNKLLCTEECQARLDGLEMHETKSGLRYKDIVVGKGPSPPTGYQARHPANAWLLLAIDGLAA